MRQQSATRSFDYINFAYGVGAAIVIIAAMFKFLGWEYSNEFFIVGLTTEAVVFIISAFEYKQQSTSYQWEKIFPELNDEPGTTRDSIAHFAQVNASSAESLSVSIDAFGEAIKRLNGITQGLTDSAENIKNQVMLTEKSSAEYASGIAMLNNNLSSGTLTQSLENFDTTMKNLATAMEELAKSAKQIQSQVSNTEQSSVDYASEMASLKDNMNKVNSFYREMLQVMGKKN